MIKKYVEIKTDFEGIHNWKDCPFKEVDFLKNPHRHKIYIKVKIETSEDREIEFFRLKFAVDEIIENLYGKEKLKILGGDSMESISEDIINELKETEFKSNYIEASASEDGQVAGIVIYEETSNVCI